MKVAPMNTIARALVSAFVMFNIILFLSSRVTNMYAAYHRIKDMNRQDETFVKSVCMNEKLRVALGLHAQECDAAEMRLKKYMFVSLVEELQSTTFLCGSQSCVELYGDILSTTSSSLSFSLVTIPVVIMSFRWMFKKLDYRDETLVFTSPQEALKLE